MATTTNQRRRQQQRLGLFWTMVMQAIVIYNEIRRHSRRLPRAPHRNWDSERQMTLTRLFGTSDRICHELLRMKMGSFHRLCDRLRTYGLVDSRSVLVEEQVAIFLNTVGHDQHYQAESFTFFRSSQIVSYCFHRVLHACLRLCRDVVINATIHNSPYEKENVKPWFTYFQVRGRNYFIIYFVKVQYSKVIFLLKVIFFLLKDVVGVIDGTHITTNVPLEEQAKYCNRKQVISQNVLVVCTFDIKFTYVLAS